MSHTITITAPTRTQGTFTLPASKSEANRALILQALSQLGPDIHNLSAAKDTQTLQACLQSEAETLDVGDAGTAMRFLTAYLAFQPEDRILTGSERMRNRPIKLLVDALRSIGADIQYMGEEGYPPLYIFGRNAKFRTSTVAIPGNVSSQYISALLMVAPTLPDGLTIELTGKVLSIPYIKMTLALMSHFGVDQVWEGTTIRVAKQAYQGAPFSVESDWSAASYGFSLAGLSEGSELFLPGLRATSHQGDQAIRDIMAQVGVVSTFTETGLQLKQQNHLPATPPTIDFIHCPDLAQTVLPYLAAHNVPAIATGLDNLRIKETDRILALQIELKKFGVALTEIKEGFFQLSGTFQPNKARIATYRDHRMAMGFAPLALVTGSLEIEDAQVVEKSFPGYWDSLKKIGFTIS